jgi:hypothetical protein
VTTVRGIIELYVALEPHEAVAAALWAIHTHVYDRFMVTPRLLLTSPIRNCGKTTLLDVLGRLVARAERHDSITAASIYHIIHATQRTLLLDEADNLEMSAKASLRAVLNSGYRKGGTVTRTIRGQPKRFTVFAPIALASIGTLPLPLMSRSIAIRMRRHDNVQSLRRFDLDDTTDLDLVYGHIRHWVRSVVLNPDPVMPTELRDARLRDNWRPLLAIAEACGPKLAASAREAAIAFTRADRDDEDIAVTLLRHIREVFDAAAVDRLASRELVESLIGLESADGLWASGGERPHKLTQSRLAAMLRSFDIQPRQLWPQPRTAASRSYRGYQRLDFEAAWRSYCGDESPHRRAARTLRSV